MARALYSRIGRYYTELTLTDWRAHSCTVLYKLLHMITVCIPRAARVRVYTACVGAYVGVYRSMA